MSSSSDRNTNSTGSAVNDTTSKTGSTAAEGTNTTYKGAENQGNNAKSSTQSKGNSFKNWLFGDSLLAQIVLVIIVFIIVIIVIELIKQLYLRIKNSRNSKPWLVKGTKEGRKRMIVLQNPQQYGSRTLSRSRNENEGIEFTYVFWLYINDFSYKYGDWKHIFHKGNEDSWPNRAPGVWLHPKANILRVYMNSYQEIANYVDISNIPMHKWFHVTIMVYSNKLDVFINGFLKKQLILNGIPKQNFGDVYINSFGGFDGFLSEMRYFDYTISLATIEDLIKRGPSRKPCTETGSRPAYLAPNWWLTDLYRQ